MIDQNTITDYCAHLGKTLSLLECMQSSIRTDDHIASEEIIRQIDWSAVLQAMQIYCVRERKIVQRLGKRLMLNLCNSHVHKIECECLAADRNQLKACLQQSPSLHFSVGNDLAYAWARVVRSKVMRGKWSENPFCRNPWTTLNDLFRSVDQKLARAGQLEAENHPDYLQGRRVCDEHPLRFEQNRE